ncbi:cytochrome c biogenesis protein CcdA [Demequina capsici]|uniref:Cytochrome c biogenesis protein CcdA n=1 Tax=Demequina capsici TaxID=3075620 RepID=A0AA96F4B6_9MICO|nr:MULTISPECIES: cytochrome c biogenesis protein CcdA [unclassified Demequina]WNM23484.1 cytochrome c biogenesis protein CcdA [Demequina sp. OYTSA14]WNM26361.1 cytochrome c biogenesis protein CcdA [Demequina sp. PMTSA13]
MITLLIVGLVSGIITAISPCVLPVLPAILTSSIQDGAASRRRPIVVVAGLVTSFAVFTLLGGVLLSSLGLPDDLLRWVGIVVLAIVGLGLAIPAVGHLLERPFQNTRIPTLSRDGNGYVMGLALGLVFVPCAGPILAAITVLAATNGLSWGLVVLTLAFSAGIAVPLLGFGLAGQAIGSRVKSVRTRLRGIRVASGVILMLTALVIATNLAEPLQRAVPGFLASVQDSIENNDAVRGQLDGLSGRSAASAATGDAMTFDQCADADESVLHNCGDARGFEDIAAWLNTPDGAAPDLTGKVVLVDFWTYSCINCQRTFPYLTAWYSKYKDLGLEIVGIHTPEFAFEKVQANVADATDRYGIDYPVGLDNDYATWQQWDQRFWPAHYLIDQNGVVRQVHYGEGGYQQTEALIQELLGMPDGGYVQADDGSHTSGRTQESYLGGSRLAYAENESYTVGEDTAFSGTPTPTLNHFSFNGHWTIQDEYAQAGDGARLFLHYYASDVYLVMAGTGTVKVTVLGSGTTTEVQVDGTSDLYTLVSGDPQEAVVELDFSPGVQAYAFTFG